MRRADRLFQIIQLLRRRRRPVTASALAERLEVSIRTIYRDIADLSATGVPIRGEAGMGYVLSDDYDLPPLMFTEEELAALALGTRVVQTWGDPELARSADSAMLKVRSALPQALWRRAHDPALFAIDLRVSEEERRLLGELRHAVRGERRIRLDYVDRNGAATRRHVRPLGLFYWGRVWTLAAWCELRREFRSFRIDRMERVDVLDERFPEEPGRSLRDLLRLYEADD